MSRLQSLTVGLPCCGVDAVDDGLGTLQEHLPLRVPIQFAWVADLQERYRAAIESHGVASTNIHLGCVEGNILKIDVTALSMVDFIISGPPCPPWSTLGQRLRTGLRTHVTMLL